MILMKGAKVDRLRPEVRRACECVDRLCRILAGVEPTLTHGSDGTHKEGSLHYKNRAVDIDWPPWNERPKLSEEVASQARLFLGPDYDVLPEFTHLHVEWDPRA